MAVQEGTGTIIWANVWQCLGQLLFCENIWCIIAHARKCTNCNSLTSLYISFGPRDVGQLPFLWNKISQFGPINQLTCGTTCTLYWYQCPVLRIFCKPIDSMLCQSIESMGLQKIPITNYHCDSGLRLSILAHHLQLDSLLGQVSEAN